MSIVLIINKLELLSFAEKYLPICCTLRSVILIARN